LTMVIVPMESERYDWDQVLNIGWRSDIVTEMEDLLQLRPFGGIVLDAK